MGNNKPLLWTAILTAAGTGSALAQITGTPAAGDYYFKDVATGKFLGAGNARGTQASLTDYGILFSVSVNNGKYILDSTCKRDANNHFLKEAGNNDVYVDQGSSDFEIIEKSNGQYVIKSNGKYLVTDGNVVKNATNDEAKASLWQIIPIANLEDAIKDASFGKPADVSFLIKGNRFFTYQGGLWKSTIDKGTVDWYGEFTVANGVGEVYGSKFEIGQTLTEMPTGLYRLTVQGFDRYNSGRGSEEEPKLGDESTQVRAKLFANENSIDMPSVNREAELTNAYKGSVYSTPDNMSAANAAFSNGLYKSDPLYVYVNNGTLSLGIKKTELNGWCCFDNFELAYVGDIDMDAIHTELTEKLAVVINQAGQYENDPTLQKLALEAAKIQTDINEIGKKTAKGFELAANYLDDVKDNLGQQIKEISTRIVTANNNFKAYEAAKGTYDDLVEYRKAKLIDLWEGNEEGQKEISAATKEVTKELYENTCKLVDDFLADATSAYEAGEAGSVDYAAMETSIKAAIDTARESIITGSTNEISYANVCAEITKAENKYNTEAARLYNLLAGAVDGEVYTDTYTEALAELNKYSRQIKDVKTSNKADYDAKNCNSETQRKYTDELEKVTAGLPSVYDKYLDITSTLRSNYAVANADVKALTESLNDIEFADETISSYYNATKQDIVSKISALQSNVDAANKAHTIKGNAPFCDNYEEDKEVIVAAISDLSGKVDKSNSEFNADKRSKAEILTVQGKLDAAKKNVAELASDDKQYGAAAKFAATADAIQNAINAVTAARSAAYKVDGTGTAEDFLANINADVKGEDGKVTRKGLGTIGGEITNYETDAQVALGAYNKVANALAAYDLALNGKPAVGEEGKEGYDPAVPGLKQKVVNTAVTINGELDGKTYAKAIEEIEARIKAVRDAFDAANDKLDAEHKAAITAIDVDEDIAVKIKEYDGSYEDDVKTWNKNNTAAAKERLLKDATRRVDDIVVPAPEEDKDYVYYKGTYGKAATELNTELEAIRAEKAAVEAQIESAKNSSDDAAAIALLSEVVTKIDAIQNKLTDHGKKATTAMSGYAAEKAKKAEFDKTIAKLNTSCNGGSDGDNVNYKGIAEEAGTESGFRFEKEIDTVKDSIKALQSDVAKSFGDETLCADSENVAEEKDEAGNVTTEAKDGYYTRAKNFEKAIENLINLARAEAANDKAKSDFYKKVADAKVEDEDGAIAKAGTDIKAVNGAEDNPGVTHFLGKLDEYKTKYDKIKADADEAYEKRVKSDLLGAIKDEAKYTDTECNMAASAETLASDLSAVKSNIEGLAALAKANEDEYKAQTKAGKDAKDQWNELFAEITNSEVSTAHEAAIAKLNEANDALETYNSNVEEKYAAGECSTNKATIEAELTDITNKLTLLKNGWADDYKAAIAADNVQRKESFDAVYTILLGTYKEKTELVNKLSKLSYASGSNQTLANITGENGIFSYIEQIRTLKTEAENSYKETEAPELWDAEEQYKAKAGEFAEKITDLATQYSDEVNKVAMSTYNEKLNGEDGVQKAYKNAISNIQTTLHVDKEAATEALSDVYNIITAAQDQIKDGVNADFAYELDNTILPAFATVDDMIAADKETAAVSTWNSTIQTATKLAESELAAIQDMGIDKIDEGETYSKPYAEFVGNSITAAAEAWAEVAEGEKYANYATPYGLLCYFTYTYTKRDMTPDEKNEAKKKYETHTEKYWAAYDAEQDRIANDTQYQNMITEVGKLQKAKDDAAEFLASLMVMHDDELNRCLNDAQNYIDKANYWAEEYKKNPDTDMSYYNSCVSLATGFTNYIYVYEAWRYNKEDDNLRLEDADAIAKEKAAISLEIGNLYKDYDLAVAQDVENTELDKYKDSIKEFTKENEKIYNEYTVGIIIGYDEKTGAPIYKQEEKDGVKVNVTTTPEEARDAYVALEKKIGGVKTALTEIGDVAHIDATIASVNEAIDALQTVVDELNAQLADCHEPVVNKFQSNVDAIAASVEAAKADLQTATDEKTILIYADNIITTINNVKSANQKLSGEIKLLEDKFDANDAKYDELCGVLKAKTDRLKEVYDAAADYEFVDSYTYEVYDSEKGEYVQHDFDDAREGRKAQIEGEIAAEQQKIDGKHDAIDENGEGGLQSDANVLTWSIDNRTNTMERELAYYNQQQTIADVKAKIASGMGKYNDIVTNQIEDRFYPIGVARELSLICEDLVTRSAALDGYARNAKRGINCDLEGNDFVNEDGDVITKQFIEVYPDIMKAAAQLREEAKQYETDVWDKSCMKGDVDNNNDITVSDYNYVRNIIIGELEYDPADPRFLAADVTGDGKVNIADVVQMANKIMTGHFVLKTEAAKVRIAARFPEKVESNSLSVVAQGTGTKQFVNIAINDVANFVGAQMDVTLPAGVSLVGATAGAGQEVVFGDVDGVTRLVVSNLNNEGFAGNDIVTLEVEVSSDYKSGVVEVSNAIFADSRGALYVIGGGAADGATGFTELTVSEKVMNKIYSVGGQLMNSLKKGVNVIINSDGTSRKVNQK